MRGDIMQHRQSSQFRTIFLFLCFLMLVNFLAEAAEWHDFYMEAQKALRKKSWNEAIHLLQQAIEQDPQPAKRKEVPGKRPIRYFPYLELANAYHKIGDNDSAFQACEESKKRGAAPKALVTSCLKLMPASRKSTDSPEPSQKPPNTEHDISSAPTPLPLQSEIPIVPEEQTSQPLQREKERHQTIQPGTKIAVLDFQGLLVEEELGVAVAEIIRTEVVGLGDYIVIERGMVEQVLKEQEFQLTGTVDSETAVAIGKLIGAELVIIGSIVKTGIVYTTNARLIDVETGVAKVGQSIQGKGEEEIPIMVKTLTERMIYQPLK